MKRVGLVGKLGEGNLAVEVDREPSGSYTFTALNEESLPLAVELGHLQAMSFRGAAGEKWTALLKELKAQEKNLGIEV